jgi:hypothetical protein
MKLYEGDVVRFLSDDYYMTTGDLYVVRKSPYDYLYVHTSVGGEYYVDDVEEGEFELVLREKL